VHFHTRKFIDEHFSAIADERRAETFSPQAAGVVPAVPHRQAQQLPLKISGNFQQDFDCLKDYFHLRFVQHAKPSH
jgi:hypothetical protein